jgi:putative transposase
MSFVKIMVHSVWGVTNRERHLVSDRKAEMLNHIRENAKKKDIFIDRINGHQDHLHALINLGAVQNISTVMQLIKGESSKWANECSLFEKKFGWADKFYAASVSESQLNFVRAYIDNQERHHEKVTFQQCNEFMKRFGFEELG